MTDFPDPTQKQTPLLKEEALLGPLPSNPSPTIIPAEPPPPKPQHKGPPKSLLVSSILILLVILPLSVKLIANQHQLADIRKWALDPDYYSEPEYKQYWEDLSQEDQPREEAQESVERDNVRYADEFKDYDFTENQVFSPRCGDGKCNGEENADNCPNDCGPVYAPCPPGQTLGASGCEAAPQPPPPPASPDGGPASGGRPCTYQDTGCESGFHAVGTYPDCKCEPDSTPQQLKQVGYCDRSSPNTVECTDKNEGASCTIRGGGSGTCRIIISGGANSECACVPSGAPPPTDGGKQSPEGDGAPSVPGPLPITGPQCQNIKIYKGGQVVTPSTLWAGDQVKLAAVAPTSSTKARFRINGGSWQETTTKINNEYTLDFTIPNGITNFTIEAQLFINGNWQ